MNSNNMQSDADSVLIKDLRSWEQKSINELMEGREDSKTTVRLGLEGWIWLQTSGREMRK